MASDPPQVFISYSHDSPEHQQRVLALAERLRKDGVDARIDQYVAGTPVESWPRWMLNQLDWAIFVLVVCTETYYRRFRGREEPGKGKGADWEGNLVTLEIYNAKSRTAKFLPVFFDRTDEQFIPEPLRGQSQHLLNSEEDYAKLYAFLTGQAGVTPGELGSLKTLARNPVEPLRFVILNLPFPPNPLFTDREVELERLRRALQEEGEMAVTKMVVMHGLGGVGKTQLAVQYAWQHLREFDALLWVSAQSPQTFEAGLALLASVLRLPEANEREQSIQLQAVLGWLSNHGRWLLIADNADTEEAVQAIQVRLPPFFSGAVLVTSRLSRWPLNMSHLPLNVLSGDDAVRYLLDRVVKEDHNPGDQTAARSLAHELGNLPLALEQAASLIVELHWSFAKYQEEFRDARPALLSEQREGGTRYPVSVAKTWSITLDQLSRLARSLLRIAAWFAPDVIPRSVFLADPNVLAEALGEVGTVSNLAIEKALGELDKFSFIRLAAESVSIHPLLQAVEQDSQHSMGADKRESWLVWAARLFNSFAPDEPSDSRTWDVWLPLSPHAETLMNHAKRRHVDALPVALVANQFGKFLIARAAYAEGEPLLDRALTIREKSLGPEHPDVAQSLNNLAELYRAQGQYAKAETLLQRALAIRETALGLEHPDVAESLNNMAELYYVQSQFAEAERLFKRALEIREKVLAPEHPDVAESLNNLAVLYCDKGRYVEAEPLFKQALEIWRKSLGPEHPEVAASLHGLARLYRVQGRYPDAEALFQQVLKIWEKSLGPEHPHVAACLNNLARLYFDKDQYAEAEPLFKRAWEIWEKCLGPEHPHVAACLNNLAQLYFDKGQYVGAEPLFERALMIYEKVLGLEHRNVATILNNLAALYSAQGQDAKAESLLQRALAIREHTVGPEHPDVAIALGKYASLLQRMGRPEEAGPLEARARAIRAKSA